MLWLITALSIQPLLACNAPVPKDGKAPVYFPIEKGAKWVYKSKAGKETRVITEVKNKNSEHTVTVAIVSKGTISAAEIVIVTEKGLFRAAYADFSLDPPTCILKTPVKSGDKWDASSNFVVLVIKSRFKVLDSEEVEVPAGRFKAVRVEEVLSMESRPGDPALSPDYAGARTSIIWYAPRVGIVKRVVKSENGDDVTVLESFTPGKADKE
jgi:hypothetical protein